MQKKYLILGSFILIVICAVIFVLIIRFKESLNLKYCDDTNWYYMLENETYYNASEVPEKSFAGTISYHYDDKCHDVFLQRCTPYQLDGISIDVGSKNIEKYNNYYVEIIGKIHSYKLEGYDLKEIRPKKIRCIKKQ